jgi:hypothetical protein
MKREVFDCKHEDRRVARVTLRRLRKQCGVGCVARLTGVPNETIHLLFAGKADPPTGFCGIPSFVARLTEVLAFRELAVSSPSVNTISAFFPGRRER